MTGALNFELHENEEVRRIRLILELLGGDTTFKSQLSSILEAHEMIIRGFPSTALTSLCEKITLFQRPDDVYFRALGISQRTFQRRKADGDFKTLSSEQSGRAWKLAEVVAKAIEVFGSQEEAEQWLDRPAIGLNQNRPIELLSTTAGTEVVEQYLERMEYGVYA
ncbi:MAG TPA: antitoxin Xre/MbcA/ParS toxin-binding domain-containing protein [Allosphingosinicella sp.]|jgi:putative toxin-antitoxin system antitoxin component (TIGR02293 family)